MKDFFCRLFTPWKAGSQFDAPEAFYSFLLGRDKLLGTIRNLCFAAALVLLILICVAIYAVLLQNVAISGDAINSIWSIVGYTVLLCFSLFKTSSVAKTLLGAH